MSGKVFPGSGGSSPVMVGDSGAGGVAGLVPAPAIGDATKFLTGAGTFVAIPGGGDALVANPLSQFAATTSLQLKNTISDETGSGALAFATSPTLVTPILGVAAATSINKVAFTAPATGATVVALEGTTTTLSGGTNTGDQVAAGVAFTPVGTVAATDVQAAIAEVDAEKVAAAATVTDNAIMRHLNAGGGMASQNSVWILDDSGNATMPTTGTITIPNAGLHLKEAANGTDDLIIAAGSALTADRTLTIITGDADRSLTLTGAASISGTNTGDETAAGLLTKILTVDGASSGLDADLLQGVTPSAAALTVIDDATVAAMVNTLGGAASTGTGGLARATSPTFVTPTLGAASATSINGTTIPTAATLVVTTNTLAALAATTSAQLAGVISDETGTGALVFQTNATLVTPALGTPSALVLTNATGLPVSSGVSGLATDVATFLGTPSSANLRAAMTDDTGSGELVFATSPVLVTPDLGTPSAAVLTSATGLPLTTGVTGVLPHGNLGTGGGGATKFLREDSTYQTIAGGGDALTSGSLAQFAATTSAELAGVISDETGTGVLVLATSPTLVTPILGVAAATRLNVGTADALVLDGVTLTPMVQVNSNTLGIIEVQTASATAAAPATTFGARTRGTIGSPAAVQSGDYLRSDVAVGFDGTDLAQAGMSLFRVDGTPGSNDMPGRWDLMLSPDGSATPVTVISARQDKSVVGAGTFAATNLSGTNTGDQTNIAGNAATVTTNADLTGPITSSGNATAVASQTGTGSKFVMAAGPVFDAGTASANTAPKLTAGTLNTTPEAGAIETDGKVVYMSPEANVRGLCTLEYIICLSGTNTLTDTTGVQALFDSVGNGEITLPVGTYLYEMLVSISGMSATIGNAAFSFAGTATRGSYLGFNGGVDNVTAVTATQSMSVMVTSASPASALAAGTGQGMQLWGRGSFRVTGAGTVIPSIALVTGGVTPVVAIGSYFSCKCIGSTSMQTVGPWS